MQTRVHGMAFRRASAIGLAAIAADAVGALVDTQQRFFDGLEDFGVGLLQLELNVDFVVAARLVGHVALAGVVLHRRLKRFDAACPEDLGAFSEERVLEKLNVHWRF